MADGCYNHIYSVLVENDQDTLGIIAYSLYKRQKIEFIQSFKVKHDTEPKDTDLAPFHDVSNSPTQLESYRNQASQLLQGFLDASIATQAAELDRYYSEKASNEIRNACLDFGWASLRVSSARFFSFSCSDFSCSLPGV